MKTYYSMSNEIMQSHNGTVFVKELPWALEPDDRVILSGDGYRACYRVMAKERGGWRMKFEPRTMAVSSGITKAARWAR